MSSSIGEISHVVVIIDIKIWPVNGGQSILEFIVVQMRIDEIMILVDNP